MKSRQRMTWAATNRQAAAPPAIPGYGVEDQDHPAHTQEDPEATDYMVGGPSEFAEDPHPPPYGDSGKPALPGVGVEDQDHPAHKGQVGRQASLMELVRRKSAKCLRLAHKMLGKTASWDAIEDQAFAFMDMADDQLDASLGRLSGDFLAEEEMPAMEEEILADAGDPVMARLQAVEQELLALKRSAGKKSNQNDPKGPTLGTSGKSEEQEKSEEKAVSDKAASAKIAAWGTLFDSFDTDRDGFVTAEDWKGPKAVFASFDTDKDGIIARHEVLAKAADDDEDEGGEDEPEESEDEGKESGKKASGKKGGEIPPQFVENAKKKQDEAKDKKDDEPKDEKKDEGKESGKKAKKSEDEDADAKESGKKGGKKSEDEEDAETAGKKGGKKAGNHKESFGHFADLDDEELEMLNAMQYGGGDEPAACGDDLMAGKTAEDEGAEESEESDEGEGADKEAGVAEFFTAGFDPMGLADGTHLTAADKAAFEEVFGKTAEDEDTKESEDEDAKESGKKAKKGEDEEPEEGEESVEAEDEDEDSKESGKKAAVRTASARTAALRPQPRKPSQGVRQIGSVPKTASTRGGGEIDELSKLWNSDPDVSGAFG